MTTIDHHDEKKRNVKASERMESLPTRKASETAILIVDDEPAMWQVFSRTLHRHGYDCHWASSAHEARVLLSRRDFDLVLCDIVMPGESGLDLSRYIRATRSHLPVIIVTGIDSLEIAHEALSLDIYGYMVKPVDRTQLLISVANALRRRELEDRAELQRQELEQTVQQRTQALVASNAALKHNEHQLEKKAAELEQLNNALSVLLEKHEEARNAMEARILANMHKSIMPYLDKLKIGRLSNQQRQYVDMIDAGIRHILSPFANNLTAVGQHLTPGEFQVAHLIRQGKSTKEISELLNLSENTIMTHRYKIRTKLGLKNIKQSLHSYLSALADQ